MIEKLLEESSKYAFEIKEVKKELEILKHVYANVTDNDGSYIRILSKEINKNKAYPIGCIKEEIKFESIIKEYNKKIDLMFSLNAFKTMRSGARTNLFCINNIAIDVDYKKINEFKDLTPKQVINLLQLDFFEQIIPTPNYVEYGNQVRLIYNLREPVYIPKNRDNVIKLAERISQVFAENLKDYGAEKQDLESYFRILNSINSKNDSVVKIFKYVNSIRYTLRELQEMWLDEIPKWLKKKKGKIKVKDKVKVLHNMFAFNSNRLLDFEKIQNYLNKNNINELRSRLCFLYRNYSLIKIKYQNGELKEEDYISAKENMLKFNKNFKYPLRDSLIEGATRVVNHRQYLYKNETMVSFLELDYGLCEELNLYSIYKTKTKEDIDREYYEKNSRKIKKNRNKKYKEKLKKENKQSKKEEISTRREEILKLLKQGFKQKYICNALGIKKEMYIRDRKEIKKQGLL